MTREEIANKCGIDNDIAEFEDILDAMTVFGKQEVENALKAASESAQTLHVGNNMMIIDEKSILNAYKVE